jgi:subtilisin family serine protease
MLVLALFGLPTVAPAAAQPATSPADYVPDELLVAPGNGVSSQELSQAYGSLSGTLIGVIPGINVHRVHVAPSARDAVEAALRRHPKIRFVEKNFLGRGGVVPNDPGYAYQWYLPQISAPAGWNVTTGSTGVPIAIIDSGVDPNHPDLAPKLLPGYNFLNNTTDTHDVLGHGTAVAGTAAAITNDNLGVAGVAWANPIMPLVVLDSTDYATYANIASAITYAADHGAKVINISIGGSSPSSTLQDAVNYAWAKGLVIAACAMNNSTSTPYYPAALSNVLAVSATDQTDNLASFSDYGSWIALSAPGTSIYTTTNGGGYGYWQGTSFASPQVAALAALVFSLNPSLTNSQVVNVLEQNADDLGLPGFDQYFGWGRINAGRTLQAVNGCPCSLWTTAATPAVVDWPDPNPVELGVRFLSDTAGSITALRFYKSPGSAGPHIGHLWTATGTLLATVTFANETASGWQEAPLPAPVPINANTPYVASYFAPSGHYPLTYNGFAPAGVSAPPLTAPVTPTNGLYTYAGDHFPNGATGTNYWVDVVFSTP